MRIEPANLSPAKRYFLMTSMILPRPIAWVGTVNEDGSFNLAPFSFFNGFSSTPPILGLGLAPHPEKGMKDTLRNIKRTGELTISIPEASQVLSVEKSSEDIPYGEDEFSLSGMTPVIGQEIKAPLIKEARVSFECTLYQDIALGDKGSTLILAEVKLFHVADELLDERGCVDPDRFETLARMAGGRFAKAGKQFKAE